MSIDIQSATPILGLFNSAVSATRSAVEIAKKTKDSMRAKVTPRETIHRDARNGYFFKEGDTEPLCPKCYEGTDRPIHLLPLISGKRKCPECSSTYNEGGSDGPAFSIGGSSMSRQARIFWQ
jgi:hypothetical protein